MAWADRDGDAVILILGAPRTGSTLLYQLIINFFCVWYPANDGTFHRIDGTSVSYESYHGKTGLPHEPSEGSEIMARWFGKGIECKHKTEMMTVLDYHSPWVIKNIWNVWRIDEWVKYFPQVQFIHIRRNRLDAAISYSKSMKDNKHGLNNSYLNFCGMPEEFKKYDYSFAAQAAAQDIDINQIIHEKLDGKNSIEIWYHNICNNTAWELNRLRNFLNVKYRDGKIPKLVEHVR